MKRNDVGIATVYIHNCYCIWGISLAVFPNVLIKLLINFVGDLTSLKPQCLMQFGAEFIQFSNIFRSSLDPQLAKTLSEIPSTLLPSTTLSHEGRKRPKLQLPPDNWLAIMNVGSKTNKGCLSASL